MVMKRVTLIEGGIQAGY